LKGSTKIYLFAFLFLIFNRLSAQIRYQQFTLGGGAGAATAYAGADLPKTNAAFYVSACYYPITFFNVGLEGQSGTLSGVSTPQSIDLKSFNNNFKSIVLDANLYLGAFFGAQQNGFLNFIKNFYGGVGYGVMINNVDNANLGELKITDHINNTLSIIQFNSGYEFNILKNRVDEPLLKADLSARFYYVTGKGIDGYYDTYSKTHSYYTYFAVGLKYTFITGSSYGRGYKKYD
jgi:hypothetical protein